MNSEKDYIKQILEDKDFMSLLPNPEEDIKDTKLLIEYYEMYETKIKRHGNPIAEAINDGKYKEIKIYKEDNGDTRIVGETIIKVNKVDGKDSISLVKLKRKYPFSEIRAIIHGGQIEKYIVEEKIKIQDLKNIDF